MKYILVLLTAVISGCALTPQRAQQMTQEHLCYAAGDAQDRPSYDAAMNELARRKLDCRPWIKHIVRRQEMGHQQHAYTYLRCGYNGEYEYCSLPSGMSITIPQSRIVVCNHNGLGGVICF